LSASRTAADAEDRANLVPSNSRAAPDAEGRAAALAQEEGMTMQKLSQTDLWPLPIYETVRDQFRRDVIAAKQNRRMPVGPYITLVFENRLTVKFQVQEILRIEKIATPEGIREELEGFNEMIPGPGELSATLMI